MRTPKPALQEQLPSASPFVPACLPPRQHSHSSVHAQEMPGASPCTLTHVSPSSLPRNVGFAVRIQPDAHLAQQRRAPEALWFLPQTGGRALPVSEGGRMGTGARDWEKHRSQGPLPQHRQLSLWVTSSHPSVPPGMALVDASSEGSRAG